MESSSSCGSSTVFLHIRPPPPPPGFLSSSCFCCLFEGLLSLAPPNLLQSWGLGRAPKYKGALVKNLSKSGLIAKFNSKDPFWRLRAKMEPSIGLAVSRTPCPHCGGVGGKGGHGGRSSIGICGPPCFEGLTQIKKSTIFHRAKLQGFFTCSGIW